MTTLPPAGALVRFSPDLSYGEIVEWLAQVSLPYVGRDQIEKGRDSFVALDPQPRVRGFDYEGTGLVLVGTIHGQPRHHFHGCVLPVEILELVPEPCWLEITEES